MDNKAKIFDYVMLIIVILVVGAGIYTQRFLVNPVGFLIALGALGNCFVKVLPQKVTAFGVVKAHAAQQCGKLADYAVVVVAAGVIILYIVSGHVMTSPADVIVSSALLGCFSWQVYQKKKAIQE
jgi:lipoprotein signal peptidase